MASEGDISVAPHRCAPLTEFLIEHMYGYLRHPKGQSKAGQQPSEDALWPWEGNCRGRTPASCSSSHLSLEATSSPLMMSRRLAGRSLAVQASVCSRHRAATRPTQRAHMVFARGICQLCREAAMRGAWSSLGGVTASSPREYDSTQPCASAGRSALACIRPTRCARYQKRRGHLALSRSCFY